MRFSAVIRVTPPRGAARLNPSSWKGADLLVLTQHLIAIVGPVQLGEVHTNRWARMR
jgi:hypothetical protein